MSIGKANFFTFGEIYDSEDLINKFIGRNSGDTEGFGIDAALDFPLFYQLPSVAKALNNGVENVRAVFEKRKQDEQGLISSHGDAGRYFVSFLDNHDQQQRFNHPDTAPLQISLGLAVLFCLQGIPCVYYGTEQGLQGTVDNAGHPVLDSPESVREALWGKQPLAFDPANPFFQSLQSIAALRTAEPAVRYGRLYFREVAGHGQDFGQSYGVGGVIAFSRILTDREAVVVANTNFTQPFNGLVLVDFDLSQQQRTLDIAYSNRGTSGNASTQVLPGNIGGVTLPIASIPVALAPMEVQIFVPA
jgi:glycosidase